MGRIIKTYGTTRYREWSILVKIGQKEQRITFKDGSQVGEHFTPATYTTDSPIIQHFLEKSPFYRNGLVRTIKTIEAEDTPETVAARERASKAPDADETPDPIAEDDADDTPADEETADDETPADETDETPSTPSKEDEGEKIEVKVTCMEDAVEYLKAHYEGYTSTKLRSKVSVERAAEEHGIVFVGL